MKSKPCPRVNQFLFYEREVENSHSPAGEVRTGPHNPPWLCRCLGSKLLALPALHQRASRVTSTASLPWARALPTSPPTENRSFQGRITLHSPASTMPIFVTDSNGDSEQRGRRRAARWTQSAQKCGIHTPLPCSPAAGPASISSVSTGNNQ